MTTDPELSITRINKADTENWQHIWENCPWATFFESPEWADVFVNTYGSVFELYPLEFAFSDGVIAFVPGVSGKRVKGKVKMLICSPGGTYGGPISVDKLSKRHLNLIIGKMMTLFTNVNFRVNPYLLAELGDAGYVNGDFTQKIDLLLPEEQLMALFRQKRVTSYAKKAQKMGYYIGSASVEQLERFYEIYVERTSRWDKLTSLYPLSFFQNLIACPMCDFLGCYEADGELIGGGLFLRSANHAISWLPIIHSNYLSKHIFEFFYFEVIFHFRNEGLKHFDFNPSGGNEGVVRFKDKFQPDRLPSPVIAGKSILLKGVDLLSTFRKRLR